jgi:uncharacterized repeat protein (TIGR02543 family)
MEIKMKNNNKIPPLSIFISILLAIFATIHFPAASAATFQIVNLNDPGVGFNENTAATPIGGNTGTTIGQQRLIAFEYAANIWGSYLHSNTPIRIGAQFKPLTCSTYSGALGSAGPTYAHHSFTGAPYPSTLYPIALASALYGADFLQGNSYHINAEFSSTIGGPGCLENSGWYYGLDGAAPQGKFDLVSVVLHELAHGLGFLSFANLSSGEKSGGLDDPYIRNLERHNASPAAYTAMTDAQRAAANESGPNLHWIGANVKVATSILSAGKNGDHAIMYAPSPKEAGSSVSHWDKSMTPNQMMEPVYTGPIHTPGLELALFKDIGWTINANYTLSVSKNGLGTISSNPSGIDCGGTCSSSYTSGTPVNLYATPASGYTFNGWSGGCSGAGACTITMDGNKSVTANFAVDTSRIVSIGKIGTGDGTVTRTGGSLNCGSTCAETMMQGATVSLSATAAAGSTFAGWSGGTCSGTGSCVFTLNSNTTVNATFNAISGGATVTPLTETNLQGSVGNSLYYSVNVPANAKNLVIRAGGGTGDADIYVKYNQLPTNNLYDCASYKTGNNEICTFPNPKQGIYHIMIFGHSPFSELTLSASYQKSTSKIDSIINLLLED